MRQLGKKGAVSLIILFALLAILTSYGERRAWAGEPTERVKQTIEEIRGAFRDKRLDEEERLQRLRKIADGVFDFGEMAKRSLGPYWRKRSAEERKEFVSLYSRFLTGVYMRKIRGGKEQIRRHEEDEVRYLDENIDDPYASVETVVITYQGREMPVEYRMIKAGGQWRAYDVIVAGVSLINNYRTQFSQIIRSSSYEDLVKRLEEKIK